MQIFMYVHYNISVLYTYKVIFINLFTSLRFIGGEKRKKTEIISLFKIAYNSCIVMK